MAFSTAELNNIANTTLTYFVRGGALAQTIQAKPLLNKLEGKKKTFPGGKDNISYPVVFDYTTAIAGFSDYDTLTYANPANTLRVAYPWKLINAGISFSEHELNANGITVVDDLTGKTTSEKSKAEMVQLTNVLEEKFKDLAEGWARTFNTMLWEDGTQSAKQVPGIRSFIVDDPTASASIGGIDQSVVTLWRNRSLVGGNAIAASGSNAANAVLITTLQTEIRQLRRYGKGPSICLCGSAFLDQLLAEKRAKGYFTLNGFDKRQDLSVGDVDIDGVNVVYDPTLDDQSMSKRGYFLDLDAIRLEVLDGEDKKIHTPARPANQYVFYRAMTWKGGLTCKQRNTSGVYAIA